MSELSQTKLKYLTSLHLKKNREEEGVFIAEGLKVINDLVKFGMIPQLIAYNPDVWRLEDFGQAHAFCEYYTTNQIQDKKLSLLSTSPGVFAVFPSPKHELNERLLATGYVFLLDNINDPGNLGTIIRTAHWFGIKDLFVTEGSVEIFSPKVVQSSMGSLAAVRVHKVDNDLFLGLLKKAGTTVVAADMNGTAIRKSAIPKPACIVFGNESNGLTSYWQHAATSTISILPVDSNNHPESLNLSVSAAIFMDFLMNS